MYEIDKKVFGAFVAQLRKEKGLTQKELAQALYISDKAVSKWETGVSIPDTALLVPLAECLEVSVTELLVSQRRDSISPMDRESVEDLVKTAISYGEDRPINRRLADGKWRILYLSSILTGGIGIFIQYLQGYFSPSATTLYPLSVIFGAYFCFWVQKKLPEYYDQNRIGSVQDGFFRMNIPGVAFNNSNWPYVILVGRIWSCVTAGLLPIVSAGIYSLFPDLWPVISPMVILAATLGGLFIPISWVARKYA